MRAKLISEAIKHLSPKSDEELLRVIENEPILDQIKALDHNPALKRKLLPFSAATEQKIRKAVAEEAGYKASLYIQLAFIQREKSRYLEWLFTEIWHKLIKRAKTIDAKLIKNELEEAIDCYREYWDARDRQFPPVIEILLKRAKQHKIDVMDENLFVYLYENNIDFMQYIVKFPSGNFNISKKDNQYFIAFNEWSDFAPYFRDNREISEDTVAEILSGEGSEYFEGYRTDNEFPDFSSKFLKQIKSVFPELKKALVEKHPEAKSIKDIYTLWNYILELKDDKPEGKELDYDIRRAIVQAFNEACEVADESEAFQELKDAILKFFEMKNAKFSNKKFRGTMSKEGAKKLITLLFDRDIIDGISYYPPQYGWQGNPEKHPDVFVDALINRLDLLDTYEDD